MTTPTDAMGVVTTFYQAMGDKDWGRLRSVLADDFTFRGSVATFDGPAEFVAGMQQLPFEGEPAGSRFIVDGEQVAHAFVWKMTAPIVSEIPMCEVLDVRDGKVCRSELFYDSNALPSPA